MKVGQWCQTESHEDKVGEAEVVGGDGGGGWWWVVVVVVCMCVCS